MAWLKQSVVAGYKDAAHMKKDNDLDPLHAREDFKQLVSELERVKEPEKAKPLIGAPRRSKKERPGGMLQCYEFIAA